MTMQYTENNSVLAGLQPDSKRDNGDRVSLIDYALAQCREAYLNDGNILDLQGYYKKTIDRNTAFHGVFCKQFNNLPNNCSLCVIGSQDCQYPLEYWLTYDNLLVFRLGTFKNNAKGLQELIEFDLLENLTVALNVMEYILNLGVSIAYNHILLGNFRKIRKQALIQQKLFETEYNTQASN